MNYFLINNKFHFNYIIKHLNKELDKSILLVNVHNIDTKIIEDYKSIIFTNPIHTYYDIFKIKNFNKKFTKITSSFNINPQVDILYVSSEQDFLNLKIIDFFFKKGAKIILLEDGTFSPLYLTIDRNNYTIKYFHIFLLNTFFFFFLKLFIKLKNVQMNFQYNIPVYRIKDYVYTNAIVTSNYDLCRNITKIEFSKKSIYNPHKNINNKIAIFANSPHNLEIGSSYFKILKIALCEFLEIYKCEKMIFCFHPRDTDFEKNAIRKLFVDIKIVHFETHHSTEEIVKSTHPKFLVSFMSTSLIELSDYTDNIIFLIDKYPNIIFPTISNKMINYLKSFPIN